MKQLLTTGEGVKNIILKIFLSSSVHENFEKIYQGGYG